MKDKRLACLFAVIISSLLTGCWDRRELNDRLFELGAGIDLQENGNYMITTQFMIPSKSGESGSGSRQSYFVETGIGQNISDTLFNIQRKLSRKISRGHRRNIFVGEQMAKTGFSTIMDSFARDSENRFRTDIWVVKGATALEFMKVDYPLEKVPAIAALKMRQTIGTGVGNSFLDYIIQENSEGGSP
ncbi:Ger(x)C family spore germination protein, partial [Paenibacillus sp. TAF58]